MVTPPERVLAADTHPPANWSASERPSDELIRFSCQRSNTYRPSDLAMITFITSLVPA